MPRWTQTLSERFWAKVCKSPTPDGCWIWTAAHTSYGYGALRINGRNERAHKVSWEEANGPIPEGFCLLHRCDNPPCIRPDHLFLGTKKDNMIDMREKGRGNYWGWNGGRSHDPSEHWTRKRMAHQEEHRRLGTVGFQTFFA